MLMAGAARELRGRLGKVPPLLVDSVIALAFTTVALLLAAERPPEGRYWDRPDALGYALICAVNLTLAARRRAPRAVFAATTLLWLAYIAAGFWPVVNSGALMLALYTVAVACRTLHALVCAATMTLVWTAAGLATPYSDMATVVAQALVVPALMWRFGDNARQLAARNRRLSELTGQLRREREENARRAVAEERVRIARELHDVVAHHMSVISVQAGLADYVFASDPDTARRALATIAGTSGEALEEMRRLLAVLRVDPQQMSGERESDRDGTGARAEGEEAQPCRPTPGLDRIEEVVQRVRGAGLPVELRTTGERRTLAPGVELCAYRVVQEALTNVLKHAGGERAEVCLAYAPDRLTVEVTNGPAAPGSRAHTHPKAAKAHGSSGHGLIGMRERARIYGGTLAAGPLADGGFRVSLTLPVHTAAGSGPPGEGTTERDPGARGR